MKTRIKNRIIFIGVVCLVILLASGGIYTFWLTQKLKPDAAVINKLGVIRGSIQRLVKLEIGGLPSDDLREEIDVCFEGLDIEIYKNNLDDANLHASVDHLRPHWERLKQMIETYRLAPTEDHKLALLLESEEVWDIANHMVMTSQRYSEKKVGGYQTSFLFFSIYILIGIGLLVVIRHHVQGRLENLVNRDGLTDAYNKRYFNEYMHQEINVAHRYHRKLSLAVLDLDFFKKINDQYGHEVGDQVLIAFSERMQKTIRKSDVFCRVGGEEFAVVLPETDQDQALVVADHMRVSVANHLFPEVGHIKVSIGMTTLLDTDDLKAIYTRADQALYQAKLKGRNRVEVL